MANVIRKALQTIILYRDGSQKMVTPGEIVTLTEKEHNELRQINPDCLGKLDEAELALRQINPDCLGKLDEAELALLEKTTASDSKAEPDKTQGKGGKAGTRAKEEEL